MEFAKNRARLREEKFFRIIPRDRYILRIGGTVMRLTNLVAYILVIVGAVNWGLFGLFDFNLVSMVFNGARATGSIIVYTLIALAALWLIVSPFVTGGALRFTDREA